MTKEWFWTIAELGEDSYSFLDARMYASNSEAFAEAKKRALQRPGKRFVVLEATHVAQAPEGVTLRLVSKT